MMFPLPKVIGHRGAAAYAPENTLASLQKAKELGIAWVEFDVQLSADEVPMVFHDEELDRTSNGTGLVFDKTLTELKKLDAGSWFSNQFAKQTIPTLKEWIDESIKLNMSINVEIKPNLGEEEQTVNHTLAILKHWPSHRPIILSSFSFIVLQKLRDLNVEHPIAMLMHEWQEDWMDKARKFSCISVNINQEIATRERVADIKNLGYGILSYTVNDIKRAQELYSWGVDGVFSDYPDKILSIL